MSDTAPRQITVILPRDGRALKLVELLRDEMKIHSSSVQTARGTGMGRPRRGQFGMEMEKDIFWVIVPAHQADEVFARIHAYTEMDTGHGGFMFQARLGRTHLLTLPKPSDPTIDHEASEPAPATGRDTPH